MTLDHHTASNNAHSGLRDNEDSSASVLRRKELALENLHV